MKYILLLCTLVFLSGCGTSTTSESSTSETIDPYADPPGYSGDPFAGFGPVASIRFPADGDPDMEVEEPVARNGPWSVQVAACGSMNAALSLRDSIAAQTDHPVFIDHIGSYFKVRVGSFASADESGALRNHFRSSGYPEAWSVER